MWPKLDGSLTALFIKLGSQCLYPQTTTKNTSRLAFTVSGGIGVEAREIKENQYGLINKKSNCQ